MTPPSCTLSPASVPISEIETAGLGDVQSGFGGKKKLSSFIAFSSYPVLLEEKEYARNSIVFERLTHAPCTVLNGLRCYQRPLG